MNNDDCLEAKFQTYKYTDLTLIEYNKLQNANVLMALVHRYKLFLLNRKYHYWNDRKKEKCKYEKYHRMRRFAVKDD